MDKYLMRIGVVLMAGSLLFTSCGGDDEESDEGVEVNDVDDDDQEVDKDTVPKIDHRLPTPNRFFEVISGIGGDAREELTNPIDNKDKYATKTDQALNFGVYFADLAYLMNYGASTKTLNYFEGLRDLADKLNISGIFSEEMMNKMNANQSSSDSLYTYSNEVYFRAYNYLEKEEKGDILSFMVIGGWIESMYIVTNIVGEYKEGDPIIDEIAQQNIVLESIYEHALISSESNEDLAEWVIMLEDILGIYQASVQSNATVSDKDEEGKLIISGGSKVVLDEAAFGTIVEKVEEMRSKIINAE